MLTTYHKISYFDMDFYRKSTFEVTRVSCPRSGRCTNKDIVEITKLQIFSWIPDFFFRFFAPSYPGGS